MPAEHGTSGPGAELLDELACSIADGAPVDWTRAKPVPAEVLGKLEWLRIVEAISLAHRTALDTPSEPAPTVPRDEPALPLEWGHLLVEKPLGNGSDCTVYRAHDRKLGREVALKLVKVGRATPAAIERLLEEARRLARVRHPNVLVVHGADRHDGRPGLWTEMLEGRTLEEYLALQGPYGADEAARIGIDLCRALAAVHGAGLVHRDVKTSNVMREQGGRIVLLDFSSVVEQASGPAGLSGTPLFMDPALFRGADADVRSDIYSLGVLLYRLVTGSYPVEASSLDELIARHRAGQIRSLVDVRPDLPPAFVRVVERALERDPARRWASAGEMERALAELVAPQPVPAPPRGKRGALLALAAAAVVVVVYLLIQRPPFPPAPQPALDLEAQWFRSTNGSEERLLPGARVAAGDELFVEVESTREAHVWVLFEDSQGAPSVLLPHDELDRGDLLAGGRRQRLPGPVNWEVDEVPGTETLLIVASTHPLPGLAERLEQLRRSTAASSPAPAETDSPLRGIRVKPRSAAKTGAPGLESIEAWLQSEFKDDVRISKIHLEKPEP